MNEPSEIPEASRSWREIPQHVKPRAMSREGRRRYVAAAFKTAAVAAFVAAVLLGGGWLVRTWSDNPGVLSKMAGDPPVEVLAPLRHALDDVLQHRLVDLHADGDRRWWRWRRCAGHL